MRTSTFFTRWKEILLGAAMLALAAFYLYQTRSIPIRSSVRVDARLIPNILGVMVAILGALQLAVGMKHLTAVRQYDRENKSPSVFISKAERRDMIPVLLTFVLILGYILSFERLGFIVSSTLCMFLLMLILTPRNKFRPVLFFLVSALVAVAVYIAFRGGLNLSLPQGILGGIF